MYSPILAAALKEARQAATAATTAPIEPLHRWLLADWPVALRVSSGATVVYDDIVECPIVRFVVDGEQWMARAWEFHPYRRTWEIRAPHQEHWRRGSRAELQRMIRVLASEYQAAKGAEATFYLEEPS